jgi:MFS family permease
MMTFLSLYLLTLGYSEAAVGWLLGVLFLGVILFQVPVAWLADRSGRVRVLLACHAVLLAGLGCVPFCAGAAGLAAWLFALGACCSALYPLGLALLGEFVPPGSMAQANAWYLASNCAGSLTGPVLIGLVIDLFGQRAQFAAAAAAVLLVLGLAAAGYRRIGGVSSTRGELTRAGSASEGRTLTCASSPRPTVPPQGEFTGGPLTPDPFFS